MYPLLILAASAAPSLDVAGSCPALTLTISGATPSGEVAVLSGTAPGSEVLPGGPCTDGVSGLRDLQFHTLVTADGSGAFSASVDVPESLCSRVTQILDVDTCTLSNVEGAVSPTLVISRPGSITAPPVSSMSRSSPAPSSST